MTDPLLDEATRLADVAPVGSAAERILATPRVLRALVERVQQAEAEAAELRHVSETYDEVIPRFGQAVIERDAARGKLDRVRAVASRYLNECDQSEVLASDVLAILDGKETT